MLAMLDVVFGYILMYLGVYSTLLSRFALGLLVLAHAAPDVNEIAHASSRFGADHSGPRC